MSLTINLSAEREVVTRPATKATLPKDIKIERIVDIPGSREVAVFLPVLGRVVLDDLSGDNYDQPAEWTNADVLAAVTKYVEGL